MAYTSEVCKGENNAHSFRNPSPEMIDQAIDALIPVICHFAILEADPPIEKYAYVQALVEREGVFIGL